MRILHVFPYSARAPGGHSNAIREFMDCQRRAGLSVSALSPETEEKFANARALPQDTEEVPYPDLSEVLAAIDRQGGGRPMIVHLHAIDSFHTDLARRVKETGNRVVLTSHGQLNFRSGFHALRKFFYLTFCETPVRHASGIQVLTEKERQRLRFLIPFFRGAVTALPHVIEIPESPPFIRTKTGARTFTILHLGRLDVRTKGLDLLVEGFARSGLKEAKLVLAGPDWNGGRAVLERMASALNCADRIVFPGAVYGPEKELLLESADLFVAASRWDAFNISLAEALGSGIPALISNRLNLAPELKQANAVVTCACCAHSFAKAIARIAGDIQRRDSMAATGRDWVRTRCGSEHVGRGFVDFYRKIMEQA